MGNHRNALVAHVYSWKDVGTDQIDAATLREILTGHSWISVVGYVFQSRARK